MTVAVLTLGCRLNAYESEVIRREATAAGLADTVVVNSCAVTGCAAQTEPATFAAMPEVDCVLGNGDKLTGRGWSLARATLEGGQKLAVGDIMGVREAAPHTHIDSMEGRARAFVQVQNGCDHRCTFCIIPFGRGNSRSVPPGEVIAQARRLAHNGCREVVLTGVDITSYGSGLTDAPTLGRLVKQILAEVPELDRLRLSSIDSVEVDSDLLDAIAEEARLMPHLHLSLQSGDDLILKRMKRRHSRADAIAFCDQVRRLRPEIALAADIIAGFPTESETMFARSVDLVDACGLSSLHVFPFSPRPGTPATRMPQVAREIVKDRARRLREKAADALTRHLDGEIGRKRRVLTETPALGRTEQFTLVRLARAAPPATLIDVPIADHDGRHLIAA